ncbi:MAG: DNA (cytosine-5-)-methyltransferase [Gammaproteobacteria bacterium]|nr:DNA (cytosine-5-)-methyltransferase [Gammaproteobacteria bacterium]NNJ84495.1 DNA (cytosine-5-)-methyltransferase [Gammaproteobacteria bacterium]
MQSKIRGASFFTGIGGFDLGFEKAGIVPTFQCEVDVFCTSILAKHWPKVEKHGDIVELQPSSIPDADVWCGGFPCQDVSVARGWLGRDGFKGKNTGLFYPFAKLIENKRPQVVIMENVMGLLNSHNGQDFAILLHSLSSLGYGVAWRTLNTRYFGAPQSRPRVFICAWNGSVDAAYHVLFEYGRCEKPENPRIGFLRASKCEITGAVVPEVAFCLAATSGRHTGTDWSRSYVAYESEVRRLTPTECERIQGYPAGWTIPNGDSSLSSEKIDSLRYKAIGNAVSVPVVEWIGRRVVKEFHNPSPDVVGTFCRPDDIERFAEHTTKFRNSEARRINLPEISGHDDAPKIRWAGAGIMDNLECIMLNKLTHMPREPVSSLLVDVLDKARPDEKYFLSSNAAKGILRRVNSQERQLFGPLTEALERLQLRE